MTGLFRYSIIRFRPFAETGEFANIGIIANEIATGVAEFRLAPRRFGRIKHFFDDVAYSGYRRANGYLRKELERTVLELPLLNSNYQESLYFEFSKQRESSVIFSESRTMKSSDDLSQVTERLYDRYIRRTFAGIENSEVVLTRNLRNLLKNEGIRHFKPLRVHDEVVPITLPLAYKSDDLYAIKPLAFSQKSPLNVFDHGASWKHRLEYLLEREIIRPHNILLALEPPTTCDGSFSEAYSLAKDELSSLPFEIVSADRLDELKAAVFEFVARSPVDHRLLRWVH